jgi:Ca2+-binding RTX toxin-like protein
MRRHVRTVGFALLAIGLCGLGIAVAQEGDGPADRQFALYATGAVDNSHDGESILTAPHMAPGDSVSGTVTLDNGSGESASLALSQSVRSEIAGLGGGRLLDYLVLEIVDASAGRLVYDGPPAALGTIALDDLAIGESRTYAFTATLPATAGDAVQNASASLDFAWTAAGRIPDPVSATEPVCAIGKVGTSRADALMGTALGDRLVGRGGNDRISGRDGADCLFGGAGNDRLYGGSGHDQLYGGKGTDVLVGGGNIDLMSTGNGDDLIQARDGFADRIRCGSGRDVAVIDPGDRIAGCERLRLP